MINDNTTHHLTQDLFQLIKKLPRLHLNVQPIEGLTKSEHELLVVLKFNSSEDKTTSTASEITNLLRITPAAGTHLFNPLEKGGYIFRIPDPKDRRVTLIGLTEKGAETTDLLLADVQGQIDGLIEFLGQEDSKTFIRLLTKVFEYITPQPGMQKSKNGA